ncbi:MAG: glycosyltransferase family 2 protein [Thermoguttaceae bacterium]|nr:glycosyltransferase family 2 protein [Thermoguttaceae bacterium]
MTESHDRDAPLLSVITPAFNEEANLEEFYRQTADCLDTAGLTWEIVMVDDGSRDATHEVIDRLHRRDARVRGVSFARNFGNQVAVSAGLAMARGEAVVIIDADLQHPIELIPKMVEAWREGYQIVNTVRRYGDKAPFLKRLLSFIFYKVMNSLSGTKIEAAAPDFKLLDRCVVDLLVQLPERTRYFKALIPWLGFRQTSIPFDCKERYAGTSSFNFLRLAELALDGIISFSTKPLRAIIFLGTLVLLVTVPYGGWALFQFLFLGAKTPGWTSIILVNLLLGGATLISLGILGEYIGRIYNEVKQRPLYTVKKVWGADEKQVVQAAFPHERGKNDSAGL